MATQVPAKLPRSWFRRARPRNLKIVEKASKDTESEAFILGGRGTVATSGMQAFWANTFAKDVTNILRGTHMEATMGSWQHFTEQGRLTPEVAIIVDGSIQRPIKNVKVFGQIVIQEPANLQTMYDAVLVVLQQWTQAARARTLSGDYVNNIHVFANNSVWVDSKLFHSGRDRLDDVFGQLADPPFFTIINTMPYAAKEERNTLPRGLAYGTWKDVRGKYGSELAVRFRYYTDDHIDVAGFQHTGDASKRTTVTTGTNPGRSRMGLRDRDRYSAGKPLSFPAINIGQPGAFNSGASSVIIKAARKVT